MIYIYISYSRWWISWMYMCIEYFSRIKILGAPLVLTPDVFAKISRSRSLSLSHRLCQNDHKMHSKSREQWELQSSEIHRIVSWAGFRLQPTVDSATHDQYGYFQLMMSELESLQCYSFFCALLKCPPKIVVASSCFSWGSRRHRKGVKPLVTWSLSW